MDKLAPYAISFLAVGASWELGAASKLSVRTSHLFPAVDPTFDYFWADVSRQRAAMELGCERTFGAWARTTPVCLKGGPASSLKGTWTSVAFYRE